MNEPIILGYESLKTPQDWSFNGRITPSKLIRTEEEKNNFPQYGNDVYDTIICNSGKHTNIKDVFHDTISPLIIKQQISDITNEKYMYCISIHSLQVYIKYTSHIAISDKAINHIRSGQAKLVFYYPSEGHCALYPNVHQKFVQLILDLKIPKNQVYFIHSDFNIENFKDHPYIYVPVNNFPFWLAKAKTFPKVAYHPDKLFLYYNRVVHAHRLVFTSLMQNNNLLSKSIFSFGSFSKNALLFASREYRLPNLVNEFDNLNLLTNTSPDIKNLQDYNPAANINIKHYENTFLSLVSDTIANNQICFISEKIFKPISIGHPFIIISSPFVLQQLRKFNYKTFSDFWDESYDLETDPVLRFHKILTILNTINNYSTQQLIEMRNEMSNILDHNRTIFQEFVTTTPELRQHTGIFKIFQKIYNS